MFRALVSLVFPPTDRAARARGIRTADLTPYATPHVFSTHYPSLAVFSYDAPPVRTLLHELKYGRNRHAASVLATALADVLAEELGDRAQFSGVEAATLIPMPISPQRYRERGFNQSALLADALLTDMNTMTISLHEHAVSRAPGQPQTHLRTKTERIQNVRNVFSLSRPEAITNRDVILLDDIVTTGASMDALAVCVAAAQPRSLMCVAIAHTPLGRNQYV